MKKYNVLMAHNYYKVPGGEDTVFINEVNMLKKNGHKVIKYTRHNDEIKGGLFNKVKLAMNTIFSLKTYREVKKMIDEHKIEVVHVHNTLPLISPAIYYAARAKKVPVVQTIHNFRLLCPGATFIRDGEICEECISKGLKCSLKHKCYRNSKLQTAVIYIMLKFHRAIGTYNKINYIALTEFNKKKLENLVENKNKIFIKPNFIEEKEYEERILENYFVYIGRLDEVKGINFLVDVWKEIDEDIQLKIIGTGPEEENIKNIIDKNKLNNISILGFKEREEAFGFLKKSRAIIVPSKWYEGFPMTITESFSLGVPVIGSKLGNIEIIIEDAVNGLLFNLNDKEDLKKIVQEVFRNIELNKILGENAYKTFEEKYTDEKNYINLKDIYHQSRE